VLSGNNCNYLSPVVAIMVIIRVNGVPSFGNLLRDVNLNIEKKYDK
jgi:hypothetical protein